MTNTIKFTDNNILFKLEDGGENIVWADIKTAITDLKMNQKEITLENISDYLCATDDYKRYVRYSDINERIDMFSNLYIEDGLLNFTVKGRDNSMIYMNAYRLYVEWDGNCVDDFIERVVTPKMKVMNDLVNKILDGKENRKNSMEYHSTAQYEKDFTYINLIKTNAMRMIELCDRQLEALADKYTKL